MPQHPSTGSAPLPPELERRISEALAALRFGTVTLVIQDGRVIQIDRHEKVRLPVGIACRDGEGI